MHRKLGVIAVFSDKLGPIDRVRTLAFELHFLRHKVAEEAASGFFADKCFAHPDQFDAKLRLADVRRQPQEKDHAWIALRRETAELAQAVHCQIKIARLTAHAFRLVTVDVVVAGRQSANILRWLDKYAHFVAIILPFYGGAVCRGANDTAQDFVAEGNFTIGNHHRLHIPSVPPALAPMPVRAPSTRPSGSIRLMNWSTFSDPPVISNTKLSVVASMTRARNASESLSASTRLSPLPRTFTMASSRSIAGPAMVMSTTRWTGTMRSSWFLICSITIGVPRVMMVMRERCFSCSVSETVRLSIL